MFKFSNYFILLAVLTLFVGCERENENECGCQGDDAVKIVDDVGVVYNSSQGFILISSSNGLSFLCNLPQELVEQRIIFTGNTRSNCRKKLESGIELGHVYLSSYELHTVNFISIGNYELSVIRSEDYGYPTGYGYKIIGGNINILQSIIPAVAGLTPFASPDDALRAGLLTLSKMKSDLNFPSLSVTELKLLGII